MPDEIATLDPPVSFDSAAAAAVAEEAIRSLNQATTVGGLEAVGALLLRTEAIASSRIEGYELSMKHLARALVDPRAVRGTARTVAANVLAMEQAVTIGDDGDLAIEDLLAIHSTLMANQPERVAWHRAPLDSR